MGFIAGAFLTMAALPSVSHAQTSGDSAAVEREIKSYLTKGSGIKIAQIHVRNVRIEGAFATADVAIDKLDSPTVFLKKTGGAWHGIFSGSWTGPGDCESMGFPAKSKMCPR